MTHGRDDAEYAKYWINRASRAEDALRAINFAVQRPDLDPIGVVLVVRGTLEDYEAHSSPPAPPPAEVKPGEVRVNRVDLVLATPDVKVWHINLDSKYARIGTYNREEVLLYADERTTNIDVDRKGTLTEVMIDVPPDDAGHTWFILAECLRYTCNVVAYRVHERLGEPIWAWTIHPACICAWEPSGRNGFVMTERKPDCVVHLVEEIE